MGNKFSKNSSFWIFLTLFLVPHFLFWRIEETVSFYPLLGLYVLAFIGYLGTMQRHLKPVTQLTLFGVASLPYFLSIPQLSVDFYRFLWDGNIQQQGINPFDFLPNEALQRLTITSCTTLDIYGGISELSLENYTPYPTINQWYFYAASYFGGSLLFQVNLLRLLIISTLLLGWYFTKKLLLLANKPAYWVGYVFLNPLTLIECIGNVHFEGVMVSWMIMAIYFIWQKKWVLGSLFLTISVQIKLIPLLLVPFVLRFLGWKKTIYFGSLITGLTVLLFALYLDEQNIQNFLQSIHLYFRSFEFNSILLYPYLNYGEINFGWNLTRVYAPRLAQSSLLTLLSLAFYGGDISQKEMAKRWLIASLIYLIFSSTVHPWYWIFPLALSLLYPNKSVLLGTFITFLSYGLYSTNLGIENYRAVLSALNLAWLTFAIYEFTRKEEPTYFSFDLRSGTGS